MRSVARRFGRPKKAFDGFGLCCCFVHFGQLRSPAGADSAGTASTVSSIAQHLLCQCRIGAWNIPLNAIRYIKCFRNKAFSLTRSFLFIFCHSLPVPQHPPNRTANDWIRIYTSNNPIRRNPSCTYTYFAVIRFTPTTHIRHRTHRRRRSPTRT